MDEQRVYYCTDLLTPVSNHDARDTIVYYSVFAMTHLLAWGDIGVDFWKIG